MNDSYVIELLEECDSNRSNIETTYLKGHLYFKKMPLIIW